MSTALKSPEVKVPRSASEISRALQRRRIRIGLLFVSPWILGFLAFFLYPFFATLFYSFTNYTGIGHAHLIGFANYWAVFQDAEVRQSFVNVGVFLLINVPLTVIGVPICRIAALIASTAWTSKACVAASSDSATSDTFFRPATGCSWENSL